MRIQIKLDVRRPLKRKKKITRRNRTEVVFSCKYERLWDFCFSCGIVSHTERYCKRFLDRKNDDGSREWGIWLKAPPRRVAGQAKSKWLHEDEDDDWAVRVGRHNNLPQSGKGGYDQMGIQTNQGREIRRVNQERKELAVISDKDKYNAKLEGVTMNLNALYVPED